MKLMQYLFGQSSVTDVVEVFRENAEAGAQRDADFAHASLGQYAAEFQHERRGLFDRFVDALNRLPRPIMVIGVFALFASAMFAPIWFAERMQGLALVPEPMWWGFGTIVAFYFGGRFQIKDHEFKRSISQTAALVPQVVQNIQTLRKLRADSPGVADTGTDADLTVAALEPTENPAIDAWRKTA